MRTGSVRWGGIVVVTCLMGVAVCHGQTKSWDRRFGGDVDDELTVIRPTRDGGYVLGGYTSSGAVGDKTEGSRGGPDYWIVKVDSNGDKQWDRRFGGGGIDMPSGLEQTQDGGYILGGYSTSGAGFDKTEGSRGGYDYWIVKLDASGLKQWDRRFGGSFVDALQCLQQTADGGYILGGFSNSGRDGDKTEDSRGEWDYWIVKVDASGAKQWDKRFWGDSNDRMIDVRQTADGGHILGGYSMSGIVGDKTEATWGQHDYWIVRVDSHGTKLWDRRFGGEHNDELKSLETTVDGGFLLGGSSQSDIGGDKTENGRGDLDYWIVKVAANGAKQWDKRYGGVGADYLTSLRKAGDGGYLLGGYSRSGIGGDKTENGRGDWDYWIVKVDAQGAKRWDRRFGGSQSDQCASGQPVADGGYILGGLSFSEANGDKTEASRGGKDYWIVKVGVLPPDAYEYDDSLATAKTIANGQTQRHSLHEPRDVDRARFRVGGGGASDVVVETSGAAGDTELWVCKGSSGAQMGYNDDRSAANRFSRLSIASLAPGTYFIKVADVGNNEALFAYDLKVNWTQRLAPDAYERDNVRASARRIRNGQTQQRNIHLAGNRDWAKFTIGSRGAVNLVIQTRGTRGDTQMWVYDSQGNRLAFDDDSGPGRFSRITAPIVPAGTYFIRVQEKGNNGILAAYTLNARWTPR